MKARTVFVDAPPGRGGVPWAQSFAPTSTLLALVWMMATAALGWLGLLTILPHGGVALAITLLALVVVPAVILWLACRSGERGGWPLLALVSAIVLLSDASLRGRGAGETGLDAQSMLKFGLWASGWLLLAWRWTDFRDAARGWSGGSVLAFGLLCLLSTAYSPTSVYTFGAAVGFLGMWMVAAVLARRVPRGPALLTVAVALGLGALVSLLLYVVMQGRAMAPTEGGTILRLAGVFSAPNTLGRAAALCLLFMLLSTYYVRRAAWLPVVLIGAPAALACLYLSSSRASMLALACALVVVVLRNRPALLIAATALGATLATIVVSFPAYLQDLMQLVSRTGRISEVATLTGRTLIWEWVVQAASERPLFGYGFASSRVVIAEGYRGPWGFTTASAHNAWLQAWISVGLIGISLMLANHLKLLLDFFRRPDRMRDGLFVFVVVLGFFEAAFTGPSVNLITFVWLWASVLVTGPPASSASSSAVLATGASRSASGVQALV